MATTTSMTTPLTTDYLPALARFDVQPVYLG